MNAKRTPRRQCTRYSATGQRCEVRTRNADGWCRNPGCEGFARPDPADAPRKTFANSAGPRDQIPLDTLTLDPSDTRITNKACHRYIRAHGGSVAAAAVHLQHMLEDFAVESKAFRLQRSRQVLLAREGFRIYLSDDLTAVVSYDTNHAERTWEQIKGGVPSRISTRGRIMRQRTEPRPPQGPAVPLAEFAATFDPATAYHTSRCRGMFVKNCLGGVPVDEPALTNAIRKASASLRHGQVSVRDDGPFMVVADGLRWLVTPDCRVLISVNRIRPERARG